MWLIEVDPRLSLRRGDCYWCTSSSNGAVLLSILEANRNIPQCRVSSSTQYPGYPLDDDKSVPTLRRLSDGQSLRAVPPDSAP
ncbi:hypothetical protein J6590_037351 [Homalodisca vitripennis]|nr:hypothetical protein J6590_037351 [Homalodisca vitripennis]